MRACIRKEFHVFFLLNFVLIFREARSSKMEQGHARRPYTIRSKYMKKIACTQFNEESAYFQQNNSIEYLLR